MPKCANCTDILPPNFCTQQENPEDFLCVFCINEIKEITVTKENKAEKYTKQQCIKDYHKLLNYMKETTDQLSDAKSQAKSLSDTGLILPGSEEFNKILKG